MRAGTLAAKRGKSQARRNNGGGGESIPGWAWLVLGVLLAVVVILVAPRFIKGDGDGFFRPQPNPDAQPVPVAGEEDAVVPEDPADAAVAAPRPAKDKGKDKSDEEYDFYTLLPGKEVPLSDAELAATERDEARRREEQRKAEAVAQADNPDAKSADGKPGDALPAPIDRDDAAATPAAARPSATMPSMVATSAPASTAAAGRPISPTASAAAPAADNTRYLLQAGAFQASGQAEELKAKIALLGLGARVESARISGKTVYRVRMGPYGTASDLSEAKRKLSAGGLPAMAIKVE
jgi:cell division protein FtsN